MSRRPRLGRPPDADSSETRSRIIDVARRLFATKGYETTSNRTIAEEAGLTTGAIYHYFDRKLDIYVAVHEETQDRVFARFQEAAAGTTTFVERLRAVLETAHALNNDDPSLAQFLGSSRVDAARDPAIAEALRRSLGEGRNAFFDEMVALGVRTGEIDRRNVATINAVLQTVTVGLTDAVSNDARQHRRAVDGIMALVEGTLVDPSPAPRPARRARRT